MIYYITNRKNIKIGVAKNASKRLQEVAVGSDSVLHLLATEHTDLNKYESDYAYEKELHRRFKSFRIKGEWFRPSKELIDYINNISSVYIDISNDKLVIYKKMSK